MGYFSNERKNVRFNWFENTTKKFTTQSVGVKEEDFVVSIEKFMQIKMTNDEILLDKVCYSVLFVEMNNLAVVSDISILVRDHLSAYMPRKKLKRDKV